MTIRHPSIICALLVQLTMGLAQAASVSHFDASFSASQSIWGAGPNGGFSTSGNTGGNFGISYSAAANSGTVNASVNGRIQANYDDRLETPDSSTTVKLQFNGRSSSLSSRVGANANVSGFVNFCAIPNIFTGGCIARIDESFALLDEGLLLDPSANFNADLGVTKTSSDADSAIGFGPNINLIVGELGAELNLDLDQAISLKPQSISGVLGYRNRATGESFLSPFIMGVLDMVEVTTAALGSGIWDFSLLDLDLANIFRNDIDLELRPTINYIVGEWPAPGSSPISLSLIDESFALDFNSLRANDLFTIEVASAVPLPAAVWLFGTAVLGFVGFSRRRSIA